MPRDCQSPLVWALWLWGVPGTAFPSAPNMRCGEKAISTTHCPGGPAPCGGNCVCPSIVVIKDLTPSS